MRPIDADALKDVIQQHDYPLADKLNSIDNGMFTLGIFQAIDQMPTIFPDEVRGVGEWIGSGDGYADGFIVYDMWECSNCGFDADGAEEKPNWNYCPSCGARMKGAEDGTTDMGR